MDVCLFVFGFNTLDKYDDLDDYLMGENVSKIETEYNNNSNNNNNNTGHDRLSDKNSGSYLI